MAIGKVIKGEGAPEIEAPRTSLRAQRVGVVNAEEFEARTTANGIIADAQKRAERILADAEAQREAKFAEGRENGRQEGLAQMTEVLAKAKVQRDALLAGAETEIIQLAIKVAEKIIGRDLDRSPEVVVDICSAAVEQARNAHQVTIRVHPKHAQVLRANMPRLMEQVGVSKSVSVKDDSEVTGGGCVLETPFGTFDAQLSTQFMMLKQLLTPDPGKKEGPK